MERRAKCAVPFAEIVIVLGLAGTKGLRLLILDNEFPPLGGGTGVINYHLMRQLDALGVCCDLVTSSRTRSSYEQESFGQYGRIFKVPVDSRNIHHASNIELIRYATRGLRSAYQLQRAAPYDVCLAFAGVPAGAMALALNRLTGLPYVLSLQGPDVPWYEQRYNRLYPWLLPLITKVWKCAAAVTAQSQDNLRLASETMPTLPIVIIPNGVEAEIFAPPASDRRGSHQPFVILAVGRLIERKGLQHLLQAVALLRERGYAGQVRAVLVGTGDMEVSLRQLCTELNLHDDIEFAGFHDRDEMPTFYRDADLFALPSFNEGMSIALLEAISAGLPVIVTDTGGTAELVQGNGLVVPWADPAALANALETFLRQPELCRTMGDKSRSIAQRYSWEAAAAAYLELCRHAAQTHNAAHTLEGSDEPNRL
jgi:glycosyltransferase involved in cell wall biosynthesis